MSRRETLIYAVAGLSIWLNGAVAFRLGGKVLFENLPITTAPTVAAVILFGAGVLLAYAVTITRRG